MNNSSQIDSTNTNINQIDPNSRRKKAFGEVTRTGEIIIPEQKTCEEQDNIMASEEELKGRKILKLKPITETNEKEENINLFPKENDKPNEKSSKILPQIPVQNKEERKNEFVISNLSENNPFVNLMKNNNTNTFLGTQFANPFLKNNKNNEEPPVSTNANANSFFGNANKTFVNPFFKKEDGSTTYGISNGLSHFALNENNMFFKSINTNITNLKDQDSGDEGQEENPETEVKTESDSTKIKDFFKESKPEVSPYTKAIKIGCSNFFSYQKDTQKYKGKGEGFFSVEHYEGKNGLIVALIYRHDTHAVFNGSMLALKTRIELIQNEYKRLVVITPVLSNEEGKLQFTTLKIIPLNDKLFNELHETLKNSKEKLDENFNKMQSKPDTLSSDKKNCILSSNKNATEAIPQSKKVSIFKEVTSAKEETKVDKGFSIKKDLFNSELNNEAKKETSASSSKVNLYK